MMGRIPDDLSQLVASGEELATIVEVASKSITKKKSRARSKSKFVMFPDVWDHQLARVKADGCTYRVAIHLLREAWRSRSSRVKLANAALETRGVSRWAKHRALAQLGEAGLVSVERRPRKSPIVTIRFLD